MTLRINPMNLQTAIKHPDVNVFDVKICPFRGVSVTTYRKPNETEDQFKDREQRNLMWAIIRFNRKK